ncbi:hypothetical protein ACVV3X_001177 [Escherichia coli]
MTALNKQALREAAQEEIMLRYVSDTSDSWQDEASPEAVLALLDELEAAEKRIAELSHHLRSAHEFIEHTEAFGHEASNGILCCGDAQWNIDASKAALASTGSINGED